MENLFTLFYLLLQLLLLSSLLLIAGISSMAQPVIKAVISIFKPALKTTEHSL